MCFGYFLERLTLREELAILLANLPFVKSIADQIIDQLRNELLAGKHAPGTPVREVELANRFQVSRHPIRKAILKLSQEGLLRVKPNCGAVVAESYVEHVDGLLSPMRKQLELYALKLAFPHFDERVKQRFESILKEMDRAAEDSDEAASLDCDTKFHQLILIAAGLNEMVPLWQSIFSRMRDFHRRKSTQFQDLRFVAFTHRQLVCSLFSNNLSLALADLGSHIEGGDFYERCKNIWMENHAPNV